MKKKKKQTKNKQKTNKEIKIGEHVTNKGKLVFTIKKGNKKTQISFDKEEAQQSDYFTLRNIAAKYGIGKLKGNKIGLVQPRTLIKYYLPSETEKTKARFKLRQMERAGRLKKIWKKIPSYKEMIQRGTGETETTLNEIRNNSYDIYKRLLKRVVNNQELIKTLIMHKEDWKHLLVHQVQAIGIGNPPNQEKAMQNLAENHQGITLENLKEILEETGVINDGIWDSNTKDKLERQKMNKIELKGETEYGRITEVRIRVKITKYGEGKQ